MWLKACHSAHLICFPDIFDDDITDDDIKTLLNKNGHPRELVSRNIKSHLNGLK